MTNAREKINAPMTVTPAAAFWNAPEDGKIVEDGEAVAEEAPVAAATEVARVLVKLPVELVPEEGIGTDEATGVATATAEVTAEVTTTAAVEEADALATTMVVVPEAGVVATIATLLEGDGVPTRAMLVEDATVDAAVEAEPVILNGKEYWNVVGSESRESLKP